MSLGFPKSPKVIQGLGFQDSDALSRSRRLQVPPQAKFPQAGLLTEPPGPRRPLVTAVAATAVTVVLGPLQRHALAQKLTSANRPLIILN